MNADDPRSPQPAEEPSVEPSPGSPPCADATVSTATLDGDGRPAGQVPACAGPPSAVSGGTAPMLGRLAEGEYRVVEDLRDRVSTRLTVEDRNYAPTARRELARKLIRDEYDQWQLFQAHRGLQALSAQAEDTIFAAVLAELDGLGRIAPLLARGNVEDIHFEGDDDTVLRLDDGQLVAGPPIASSDAELEQQLRAIGARYGNGQTSRELSAAHPILNVRLTGVTELGARLQAAMDVLPRIAGVIRVHRFSNPTLDDLRDMKTNMIDTAMHAFLYHAVRAGASLLVSGNPAAGKTTILRSLGNAVPHDNVLVTVEDERELGLHLARWDPRAQRMVKRHAVCRSFESRLPNAEGQGGFDMGDALHEALRMSPTWIAVGEVRGAYVTYLLEAATSGIASVMGTIHARSADSVFKKVMINALKATPAPDPQLVLASLSELDLVIHVHRDAHYDRYVSGIYELGEAGDAGKPALTPIFAPPQRDLVGRPVAQGAGSLSDGLRMRLEAVGFDAQRWLDPGKVPPDWRIGPNSNQRAS